MGHMPLDFFPMLRIETKKANVIFKVEHNLEQYLKKKVELIHIII
jgi:hypothetical protein